MRPEFAARRHGLGPRGEMAPLDRILVSLGLTDPLQATRLVLDGIEMSAFAGSVDVVLGPTAPYLAEARARAKAGGRSITVHSNVPAATMVDLIVAADLVIGAAGTSSYERACLGAPTLLVELAENQRDNIAAFVRAGAALPLGPSSALIPAAIAEVLNGLLANPAGLARMSMLARALVDGRGAQRVALVLRPEAKPRWYTHWFAPCDG